ncbi:MAG: DUF2764 family protein [Candidatus Omnitrophica bacterium]|nr:DUF2764 family protein [Candidatus Omnitrophota bacterium]
MSAYYVYLISSLPVLNYLGKLPFNLENFLNKCRNLIPDKELEILRSACGQSSYSLDAQGTASLKRWVNFEITLRNELVHARAARKKVDPLKSLRLSDPAQAWISHVAMAAYRSNSILEAEKILDQARWSFLEDLSLGHYFDFDFLLIYGLRLKILERWEKIQTADKEQLLNTAVLN